MKDINKKIISPVINKIFLCKKLKNTPYLTRKCYKYLLNKVKIIDNNKLIAVKIFDRTNKS